MKKRALLINIAIMFWVIAAEVLVINASSKAQNQPLSFDVVEAVSTVTFVFHYFHLPLPLAILLAIALLLLPGWLMSRLVRRYFGKVLV